VIIQRLAVYCNALCSLKRNCQETPSEFRELQQFSPEETISFAIKTFGVKMTSNPTSGCKGDLSVIPKAFRMKCIRALATVTAAFLLMQPATPQETRGTITGEVRDPSGAVVPSANITARNGATNVTIKAATNSEGKYVVPLLISGHYTVTAAAAGFKSSVKEDIELRIADHLQIDFSLELGSSAESVQVTGESPLLQTATANIGTTIDSKRISELPVAHGSVYTLMYLTPGVNNVYPNGFYYQTPTEMNATSTMTAIQGAPLGSTDFTVDGVPNTQTSNANYGVGVSNSPPADAVQEFKVETAFDASVGRTSGTIINVVLKTGSNLFHGTGYGFFRQPDWNANTFFANKYGQEKGDFHYQRWGASLNGPIIIPKVYSGKDKSFFSFAYEGLHNELVTSYTGSVPDPKYLGGDLSPLLKVGSQYQVYDPSTIQSAGNGRYSILPFANNIIPANRLDKIAQNVLSYYPAPNAPGSVDGRNNYTSQTRPEPLDYYNVITRYDQNLTEKQRLFFRFSVSRKNDGPYRNYWDNITSANIYVGKTRQATLDYIYTFSPSLVMDIRYGYGRYAGGHKPRRLGFDLKKLGFSDAVVAELTATSDLFPRFDVSGLESLAFEGYDTLNNDVHTLFNSFTKQWKSHNLKFGADIRAYRDNVSFFGHATGRYQFSTNYTRGPLDNSPSSPGGVGQGLAAILLGQPTGGFIARNDNEAIQSTYWSLYIHDNWRVTRNLTLDIGVRWEYEGPTHERYNRTVRGFDFTTPQAIDSAARAAYAANPDPSLPVSQFDLRGGVLFAGRNGVPENFYDRVFTNFEPRFGFAYQMTKKMVWRGGFGMYPISIGQPAQNRSIQSGFNINTNVVPTLNNGQTFIATLDNPFPNGILQAPGASQGIATFLGQGVSFYNPSGVTPYTMRWTVNFQTLLPGSVVVEAGYVGSKALKLQESHELDGTPLQYLSRSPVRDQATINYLTSNVTNPMAGLIPGTSLNGSTISRAQLLLPFPQFTSVGMIDYQGYTWYNAFQLRAERRFANGFTGQFNYTFSKQMDATEYLNPADPRPSKVISAFDRPQQIGFSSIYELPFGRGRHYGSSVNAVTDGFIGGWQLGAIWLVTSGEPFGFGNFIFTGNLSDIPLPTDQRSVDRWINTDAGFVKDPAQQLAYNVRTASLRYSGIRAGAYNSWDISVLKNTKIHERHEIQFRAEFLNTFNHQTAFAPPDTDPTSSTFGQVTNSYSIPRTIQLGIKYLF
jgi:hypothetical protein